ncbi:hypothetical protein AOQ71_22920 [Bradyrhizobium manausense]|uniref:Uncharacterized protein n=1 Tax=Bradyrhizobium manausense TaxID=989370 RepID=A0A0R3DM40_9BRAD|nr:hypothetical protein AOQ71_22920 [Bradyrhizobium manausense]
MLDAVTEFILLTMLVAKEVSMLLGTLCVAPAKPSGPTAFGWSALAVLFCKFVAIVSACSLLLELRERQSSQTSRRLS